MRAKNSNITIERFLKDETYRLKNVNEDIGEDLRADITDRTKRLQRKRMLRLLRMRQT